MSFGRISTGNTFSSLNDVSNKKSTGNLTRSFIGNSSRSFIGNSCRNSKGKSSWNLDGNTSRNYTAKPCIFAGDFFQLLRWELFQQIRHKLSWILPRVLKGNLPKVPPEIPPEVSLGIPIRLPSEIPLEVFLGIPVEVAP